MILRGFSRDGIHLVNCEQNPAKLGEFVCYSKSPLRARAFRPDFNGVVLPDGTTSDVLERSLNQHVETPAASAIQQIVASRPGALALDVEARKGLCQLAGIIHANSPIGRQRFDSTMAGVFSQLKSGAKPSFIASLARATAFDPTDVEEVTAFEQVWSFMQGLSDPETQKANASRLSIHWGRLTAKGLMKMSITVLRIDSPPFWILPDVAVLGLAHPGGDLPDADSFLIFPIHRQSLVVYSGSAAGDSVVPAGKALLDTLYRTINPHRGKAMSDWDVQAAIAGNSLKHGETGELFAHSVDDITAMGKLLLMPIEVKRSPGHPRSIILPTTTRKA